MDEKKAAAAKPEASKAISEAFPQDGVLTHKDIAEAKASARKALEEDRRKAARKAVYTAEMQRLKVEEGLVVGGVRDEIVEVLIDLVEPHVNSCLLVNFKPYWHGRIYPVPRHVADSLNEQMWRLKEYTSREIKGEKRGEFYRTQRAPVLKPTSAAA